MIVLTQHQIEALKQGLIPTDLQLSFQHDINYMIDLNGYCLISIYDNGDADVIEEDALTDEEFVTYMVENTTLIYLR